MEKDRSDLGGARGRQTRGEEGRRTVRKEDESVEIVNPMEL